MSNATLKLLALACCGALLLSGCALRPVQTGMTRDEVASRLGQPGRVIALPGGTRLQYSGQPAGQWAVMVDLDAAGRVATVRQVLNAKDFNRIEIDKWTRQDVELEFGPPASIDRVMSWPFDIMAYRWIDIDAMFFWVYLDQNNVVQRTGQGIELRKHRFLN